MWNEEGAALKLVVTPPWWKTTWDYTGYGVLIIAFLYGARRFEINQREQKATGALIHYLTTERDILDRPRAASTATGILALGNPAFDARPQPAARLLDGAGAAETLRGASPCGHFQQIRFTALDGTRLEVQDISALWPSTLGSRETRVGQEASEQAFKEAAARHRVLHLATHGFFLDGACLPTAEARLTRGVGALAVASPAENPLRLSGLALAGANRRAEAKPDEDDGILTAEEVAMLDLQGVEWAVLSACDTGVGEIKSINDVDWPRLLTHLEFGGNFNQPINEVVWPQSLICLKFSHNFDRPIDKVVWPQSLTHLVLNRRFKKSRHYSKSHFDTIKLMKKWRSLS